MAVDCLRLSVCLSVPGSCLWRSRPCSPSAVHPRREGRAASASWHGADVELCHSHAGGKAHPGQHGHAPGCAGGVRAGGAAWVGAGVSLPRGGAPAPLQG